MESMVSRLKLPAMGLGIILILLSAESKIIQAQADPTEQLQQIAQIVEAVQSCHLQCRLSAEEQRTPYKEAAAEACSDSEAAGPSSGPLGGLGARLNCIIENTDHDAMATIDAEEAICQNSCLIPDSAGMTIVDSSQMDSEAIQLCQINCYLGVEGSGYVRSCWDSDIYDQQTLSADEHQFCDAYASARYSLCGRNCIDPSQSEGASTVLISKVDMDIQANKDCFKSCGLTHTLSMEMDCADMIDAGTLECSGNLCSDSMAYCSGMNKAGLQNCRFKCMADHAATP